MDRKKHRMQAADFYIMMAERFWLEKRIGGNENQIAYPTYEELKKCMPKEAAEDTEDTEDTEYTYLFAVDDKSYYLGKKENVGILSEQM